MSHGTTLGDSTFRHRKERPDVFISYARSDGKEFAADLRRRLTEEYRFNIWQDIVEIEGGKTWWSQIEEAIKNVEYLVLVMTPSSLRSETIVREWRLARQEGVCVLPVIAASDLDSNSMPLWMRKEHFIDPSISEQWNRFIHTLQTPCQIPRVPFMVGELPENFVRRNEKYEEIVNCLYDRQRDEPLANKVALCGTGGFGKTTLAIAICHDERVLNAFHDGILQVTLGENPKDLTGIVTDLIRTLNGDSPIFGNLEAAVYKLKQILEDRHILIVIDDLWSGEHLLPFIQGGQGCARLITTRNLDTLPDNVHQVRIDAMEQSEAIELLVSGFEEPDFHSVKDELDDLAKRLGEWPLLLTLVNGFMRRSAANENRTLAQALDRAKQALIRRGLAYFEIGDSRERTSAVEKTIGISLELLPEQEQDRYFELAIFPESVDIPLVTLEKLWAKTGELDDFDTDDLCTRLNRLSLLFGYDAAKRSIRLHNVIRNYLIERNPDRLSLFHNQLLDAYKNPFVRNWSELPEDEPYLWDYLALHLIEAGREKELVETAKDWRYLAKKTLLRKSFLVESDLLEAEKVAPADESLRTLRRCFANSGHLFNHCSRDDIEATLLARLQHLSELEPMLRDLARSLESSLHIALKFNLLPDLPHPALIRTLEGHLDPVSCCGFSPDGRRIASASVDKTLRVWDAISGRLMFTLKGHDDAVLSFCFSPNNKLIASASRDRTLKVWDANSGILRHTLEGHTADILSIGFSPDSKLIVSASSDKSLKVWKADTGELLHTLEGHSKEVNSCAISSDRKLIVSASNDCLLKVWDADSLELSHKLEGYSESVESCAISKDGKRIVTTSSDQTLKIWDADTGELLRTLEGHSETVNSCAISGDGKRILSASDDRTLKIWDADTGEILRTLERTLEIRDADTGEILRQSKGHSDAVLGSAFSPDDKLIVSASADRTLIIWNGQSGDILRTLETRKVKDTDSGTMLYEIEGHSDSIWGCNFSFDSKLVVSASDDSTLKIWDWDSDEVPRTLKDPLNSVRSCSFSPDDRLIISASLDNGLLKIWDCDSGEVLRTLKGHSAAVESCCFSQDGELIVSASKDHTLKVWNAQSGDCLATFYADGPMYCCAMHGKMIVGGGARGVYFLKLVQ